MHQRTSTVDCSRISISSAPSSSSQGSGPDDVESLGDVYVWGEIWCDGTDGSANSSSYKTDMLLPRLLESNVVLDVHQIACGSRHAAIVTKQGEVFTWGEESGGRLGHGTHTNVNRPQLVESLTTCNVDYVACGEYHTCAISTFGDLFTWGDGTYNAGILGHGTDVSHWMPKRVSGPMEGYQVLSLACGTWHSALITSEGKLFTFGEGTYGALGHGDRERSTYPREVQSLSGLKTIKVACGVWHSAAIVEFIGQPSVNAVSRKLFTWGDGGKNCLGHGDKEARLVPTGVSLLADYNFHQLACGHFLTVGLTTSGHVFTMGSAVSGQLGNPQSDGGMPCLVQDKLASEVVDEIASGAYHVAVVTSRSEVFTWGRGANGRLGHGDAEDRKTPTLVEALKDRHVKSIACGSNFTASICIHKWVSAGDQSLCSGCRQAFGFTRKRHNCYNCGMVFCHACSSNKVLRAALAPTPGKLHRVCDSCNVKLKTSETSQASTSNSRTMVIHGFSDGREKPGGHVRPSKLLFDPSTEKSKSSEVQSEVQAVGSDSSALVGGPTLVQLKDISLSGSLSLLQSALKPVLTSPPPPPSNPRPASPYLGMKNLSPLATPVFSLNNMDSLKKANELLNQEVRKLQGQVRNLKQKCDLKDTEIQSAVSRVQEVALLAAKETDKCRHAEDVVKSFALLMKDVVDRLTSEVNEKLTDLCARAEKLLKVNENYISNIYSSLQWNLESERTSRNIERSSTAYHNMESSEDDADAEDNRTLSENTSRQNVENGSPSSSQISRTNGEEETTEQFAPGVFITLVKLQNGVNIFKQVRFSKRRFAEQQAEEWWKNNKDRVMRKYGFAAPDTALPPTSTSAPATATGEETATSSQP